MKIEILNSSKFALFVALFSSQRRKGCRGPSHAFVPLTTTKLNPGQHLLGVVGETNFFHIHLKLAKKNPQN
jgi:hypothetical protein